MIQGDTTGKGARQSINAAGTQIPDEQADDSLPPGGTLRLTASNTHDPRMDVTLTPLSLGRDPELAVAQTLSNSPPVSAPLDVKNPTSEVETQVLEYELNRSDEYTTHGSLIKRSLAQDFSDEATTYGSLVKRSLAQDFSDEASSYSSENSDMLRAFKNAVDINRTGIIPLLTLSTLWGAAASGVLFAIVWIYAFDEVLKQERSAAELAVDHARLHVSEILAPLLAVSTAVDAAFRAGAVDSIADYTRLTKVLAPHFSTGLVQEVEMAGSPGAALNGSVLAARSVHHTTNLHTDRDDCLRISGRHGCTKESLGSNLSSWYRRAVSLQAPGQFQEGVFGVWHQVSFVRHYRHEVICPDFCWEPVYEYVAKISSGPTDVTTGSGNAHSNVTRDEHSNLMRAAAPVSALREAARKAGELSRGEAFITDAAGVIIAAADMGLAMQAEIGTGTITIRRIWELPRPWAADLTWQRISEAAAWEGVTTADTRVSVWRLDSLTDFSTSQGESLRLLLAVPRNAFLDHVLGPLVTWSIAASAAPVTVVALMAAAAALFKLWPKKFRPWEAEDPKNISPTATNIR